LRRKLTYRANARHDRLQTHTNRRLRVLRTGVTVQGWIDNAEAMVVLLKTVISEQSAAVDRDSLHFFFFIRREKKVRKISM